MILIQSDTPNIPLNQFLVTSMANLRNCSVASRLSSGEGVVLANCTLDRNEVGELIQHLKAWLETGSLELKDHPF